MLTLASVVTLLLFALVVSQPFFYALALGQASTQLSASAYVELRQRINAVIAKPLVQLYGGTIVSCIFVVVLALRVSATVLVVCSVLAALSLVVDLVIAVQRNVPINQRMNGWSTAEVPSDWETHRAQWNAAFTVRQVVLTLGFVALVVGVAQR